MPSWYKPHNELSFRLQGWKPSVSVPDTCGYSHLQRVVFPLQTLDSADEPSVSTATVLRVRTEKEF